jgi:hypothetical protein
MELNQKNLESAVSKNGIKNSSLIKYLAAFPMLSWILVALIFTVSFAANAGTRPN